MKCCKDLLALLFVMALLLIGSAPSYSAESKKELLIDKARGNMEFYEVSVEIERLVDDLAQAFAGFAFSHKKGFQGRIKDDLKALDNEFIRGLKFFPMEEKGRLKKLKAMVDEMKPLFEEVFDLQDMVTTNIEGAVESGEKAKSILRDRTRGEAFGSKGDENKYRELLPLYYEMEINLSEMLSRNLFYIMTGREDLRGYARKDRALLNEALEHYIALTGSAKTLDRDRLGLSTSLNDSMRSIEDAVEDYERLKPRLSLLQDTIFSIDRYIDLEIQKSSYR
jgi:hypothetical protein